jgi:2-oxoisovalerate dehydrogenase E1 component beta subunit
MAEMTYIQAISDALRLEMRRDPRVFVLGEDVGVYGGAFKVSLGFQEEFGPWRVIDTPLSETAIVGGRPGRRSWACARRRDAVRGLHLVRAGTNS